MAAQSYDRLEGVIWYDGKLVPWGDATLHVLSHGLHYGSSVFEGERAYALHRRGVAIDMPVELTLRRLHEGGGFHNYFWKARPIRAGEGV